MMLLLMIALCASVVAGELERAPFETISTDFDKDIVFKKYLAGKWASSDYTGKGNRGDSSLALRRFRNGTNDHSEPMNKTLPILTKSSPGQQYTLSFPLAQIYQANAPQPTEGGMYIEDRAELKVYTKSYIGWNNIVGEMTTLAMLRSEVGNLSVPAVYYRAGFGPVRSPDAYNEIWLEARE